MDGGGPCGRFPRERDVVERHLTVTYSKHTFASRRETLEANVLGTRQESDQSGINLQLESLILAQNERWRQA